ncbi:hypothetical protein [Paenibacillus sp. LHD-38]|uniref:hypothetical protein n=1 Tax=Paenibacillus sp. LHD-38 TaxID=3072143 RepID=UPI00280F8924|nr:hypothetical protein [Paenibacillus sp. LHD-38]MDQ8735804.1 hypothetical protein [Paenibacillus sp. LHD-38]
MTKGKRTVKKIEKNNNKSLTPKKERGRAEDFPVDLLKELALKMKSELNGAKLTYLGLQKKTGIGRNTWARKIPGFIDELNKPIISYRTLSEKDEVYLPNMAKLIEVFGDNKIKLLEELTKVELIIQKIYSELLESEKELERNLKYKQEYERLSEKKNIYQQQAAHYEELYKRHVVSSSFEHLRKERGIQNNILDFDKDIKQNTQIKNLHQFFPETIDKINESLLEKEHQVKKENFEYLKELAPGLLEDE